MKNLYLVESPLQVLNAYEAIFAFPAQKHVILIRLANLKESDQQIIDTLTHLNLASKATIYTETINGENRNLKDLLRLLFLKLTYSFKSLHFNRIFIGNYGSPFMKFIIPKSSKLILLDDGAGSINVQREFTESHYYNWFSIFELPIIKGQVITKNNYNNLNKSFLKPIDKDNNTILFIGSKIAEAGITTEQHYLELIQKISQRFKDKKIIYIPHRGENKNKLKRLEQNKNIQIEALDYPVEMLSVYNNLTPELVVSFYSTALITLSKIYHVKAVAFKFDYSKSDHKLAIDQVYHYCSSFMTIIEEENI